MSGINSNVVLMLKGDGAAGSFFDKSYGYSSRAITNTGGVVSALNSAFDGGAFWLSAANIRGPHEDVLDFWTSNFTVDFRVLNKLGPTSTCKIFAKAINASNRMNICLDGSGRFNAFLYSAGATMWYVSASGALFPSTTFKHVAVTRNESIYRLFIDGTLYDSQIVATPGSNQVGSWYIGQRGDVTGDYFTGYLEEFRIVKGVAVWTSDFTPPTEAYSPDIPVATLQVTQETATRIEKTYAGVSEAVTITEIPFDISDAPFEVSLSATANNGQICKHTVDVKVLELSWLSPNAGVPFTSDLDADLAPIEATWTPVLATVDPTLFPLAGLTAHRVMDVELSPIVMDSSARAENTWQLEAILERIEGSLTGRQNVYGTINKNLRPITMSGESVYVHILGQIDATLNPIYLAEQMHANTWKAWSLAATLENITLSATGHQDVYGSIAQDLQAIGADIEIDSLVFEIIAMNLLNKAVTNFSNYPFNSFCYFNGRYYGCARDGIYELTGVSDYGTDIASYIKTGLLDLEVTALQRIRHAYLGFKSSGVLTLTITTDDGTSYSYTTENLTSNYQGQKVKFGKGFKDRYFQLKIANTDGCTFAIDKTRVFDEPISHRKR